MGKDWGDWRRQDISPSRLKTFSDCPRKYFYQYVQKIKTPNRLYFLSGNVFDEIAMEEFRADPSQDVEPIVELAGDILHIRIKEAAADLDKPLLNLDSSPVTEAQGLQEVMDFRTWTRGFLLAWQNGEDHLGNRFQMPPIADTQVQCIWPIQIDGQTIRINGFADITHTDGSVTDLKMASYWKSSRWTSGRIMSELQWVPYSQALNSNKFRYIVTDKHKSGWKDKRKADAPTVRTFDVDVYPQDVDNFKDLVTSFVRTTDFLNDHLDGVFPPKPQYKGDETAFGQEASKKKFNEYSLPQVNFCRKLCDFKDTCFKECFGGTFRSGVNPEEVEGA